MRDLVSSFSALEEKILEHYTFAKVWCIIDSVYDVEKLKIVVFLFNTEILSCTQFSTSTPLEKFSTLSFYMIVKCFCNQLENA